MKPKEIIKRNKEKIIKALELGAKKTFICRKLGIFIRNFDAYYWSKDPDYKIAKAKHDTIINNIFDL